MLPVASPVVPTTGAAAGTPGGPPLSAPQPALALAPAPCVGAPGGPPAATPTVPMPGQMPGVPMPGATMP